MDKNWDAVATVITTRLEQLQMTQQELAAASDVSTATLRELQNNRNPRNRAPRLLAAISTALQLPPDHLKDVVEGRTAATAPDRLTVLEGQVADLTARLRQIEATLSQQT